MTPAIEPEVHRALHPPPRDTLAAHWASLCDDIFDADDSPHKRAEMRRAFYAGAQTMFTLFIGLGTSARGDPTMEDLARVDRWCAELTVFLADLEAGRDG